MQRAVRAFLLWVVAIALPLQGLAAATMGPCLSGHPQAPRVPGPMAPAVQPGPAAFGDGHGHAHGHEHAAGHHHGAASASPAPQAAHDTAAASGAGGEAALPLHADSHACAACEACCMGLALPARFVPPQPDVVSRAVHAPAVAPVATHPPDGLDRPPRTVLA